VESFQNNTTANGPKALSTTRNQARQFVVTSLLRDYLRKKLFRDLLPTLLLPGRTHDQLSALLRSSGVEPGVCDVIGVWRLWRYSLTQPWKFNERLTAASRFYCYLGSASFTPGRIDKMWVHYCNRGRNICLAEDLRSPFWKSLCQTSNKSCTKQDYNNGAMLGSPSCTTRTMFCRTSPLSLVTECGRR